MTKVAGALSRGLGRGSGQALPGLLAERIDPHLAGKLAAKLPNGVILVTGTNGKTTTTKLIAAVLAASGEVVLVNKTGSNLKRGITSSLISAASLGGRLKATVGLFEVDEASLRQVARDLNPRHIVVLNLFRDQLDRYGELDTTAAVIGEGISATAAHVYLNADDPLVASMAKYAHSRDLVSYFGIEGLPASKAIPYSTATDSDRCPICNKSLLFSRIFYGHIGHYHCPDGHFNRPRPSVVVTNVDAADEKGSEFTVSVDGKRSNLWYPLPGTYNIYNALAAISLLHGFGVDLKTVADVLAKAEPAFGRVERVEVSGRIVYLLLIKNPAGFSQILQTFLAGRQNSHVLMAINDLAADGRDVSWLWDVPLELLAREKPQIVTSGIRGADMSLRLRYADIDSEVVRGMSEAVTALIKQTPVGDTAYILPTYTAMIEIRKVLSKLTQLRDI